MIATLENERQQLQNELDEQARVAALGDSLQKVDARLAHERERQSKARGEWLSSMSASHEQRLQAEKVEREVLAEINKILPDLLQRLSSARRDKTNAVTSIINKFGDGAKLHNIDRVSTAQLFRDVMQNCRIDISQFPAWCKKDKRIFGEWWQSKYVSPNTGKLAHAINEGVSALKNEH